jgi:hypothetical protein
MPYWIINDKVSPWLYYVTGFRDGQTTTDVQEAAVFDTVQAATEATRNRPDLYAQGWKLTPVVREESR